VKQKNLLVGIPNDGFNSKYSSCYISHSKIGISKISFGFKVFKRSPITLQRRCSNGSKQNINARGCGLFLMVIVICTNKQRKGETSFGNIEWHTQSLLMNVAELNFKNAKKQHIQACWGYQFWLASPSFVFISCDTSYRVATSCLCSALLNS